MLLRSAARQRAFGRPRFRRASARVGGEKVCARVYACAIGDRMACGRITGCMGGRKPTTLQLKQTQRLPGAEALGTTPTGCSQAGHGISMTVFSMTPLVIIETGVGNDARRR
jgi:hypothetical protein